MRVLAVDPGEIHIGLAISDPLSVVAKPLGVLEHVSREVDARELLRIASDQDAGLILIGVPYGEDGEVGHQARKSLRLVEQLEALSSIEIRTWDESGSTQRAMEVSGGSDQDINAIAAAYILQDYLDAKAG